MDWDNAEQDEEIKMRNGHFIVKALAFLKKAVTEDELLDCFIASNHEPHNAVRQELKRILSNGVDNGFILKNGYRYALPSQQNMYEADGDDGDDDMSVPNDDYSCIVITDDDDDDDPNDDTGVSGGEDESVIMIPERLSTFSIRSDYSPPRTGVHHTGMFGVHRPATEGSPVHSPPRLSGSSGDVSMTSGDNDDRHDDSGAGGVCEECGAGADDDPNDAGAAGGVCGLCGAGGTSGTGELDDCVIISPERSLYSISPEYSPTTIGLHTGRFGVHVTPEPVVRFRRHSIISVRSVDSDVIFPDDIEPAEGSMSAAEIAAHNQRLFAFTREGIRQRWETVVPSTHTMRTRSRPAPTVPAPSTNPVYAPTTSSAGASSAITVCVPSTSSDAKILQDLQQIKRLAVGVTASIARQTKRRWETTVPRSGPHTRSRGALPTPAPVVPSTRSSKKLRENPAGRCSSSGPFLRMGGPPPTLAPLVPARPATRDQVKSEAASSRGTCKPAKSTKGKASSRKRAAERPESVRDNPAGRALSSGPFTRSRGPAPTIAPLVVPPRSIRGLLKTEVPSSEGPDEEPPKSKKKK